MLAIGSGGATIEHSLDGGLTWRTVHSGTPGPLARIRFLDEAQAVAVGARTVLISADGGASWSAAVVPAASYHDVDFHGDIGLIVGASGRILRSVDSGETWGTVTSPSRATLHGVAVAVGAGVALLVAVGMGVAVAVGALVGVAVAVALAVGGTVAVGDEVVVGFLDADPRFPVVLGQLHSSAKPAPVPGADDNHLKGYVSRSGITLGFDDEKVAVVVETPAGNSLVLSEDAKTASLTDQHGNKVVLDDAGITLESSKDLVLKASGNLSLTGTQVEVAAQSTLKVEGQASVGINSSGTLTVKGSLVQIN